MLNALFNHTTIPVTEQVLAFTESRQNVLAGNIANLDTPGYHARDLSPAMFQSKLQEALEVRAGKREPLPSVNAGKDRSAALAEVSDSVKSILYHDDSDFGLEQQVAEVNKNLTTHNLAIAVMTSQFRLLSAAISERV